MEERITYTLWAKMPAGYFSSMGPFEKREPAEKLKKVLGGKVVKGSFHYGGVVRVPPDALPVFRRLVEESLIAGNDKVPVAFFPESGGRFR